MVCLTGPLFLPYARLFVPDSSGIDLGHLCSALWSSRRSGRQITADVAQW